MKTERKRERNLRVKSPCLIVENQEEVSGFLANAEEEKEATFCCWQVLGAPPCCREVGVSETKSFISGPKTDNIELTEYSDDEWRYFIATSSYTSYSSSQQNLPRPLTSLRELLEPESSHVRTPHVVY